MSTSYTEQRIESDRLDRRDRYLRAIERGFSSFAGDYGDEIASAIEKGVVPANLKSAWSRYREMGLKEIE